MSGKTLMVQGTGSGVGKSILTAGLCRLAFRRGIRVAPFKGQNMALNSFVTRDGAEIGRAQAYQAEASGIPPCAEMNPILLKPLADNLSQIIVMGKAVGSRDAGGYYERHAQYKEVVLRALATLRSRFDLVVMEGAGSPAEINLKQWDLVNMSLALWAEAPVLIVGDIDRGGVFAWMKGTFDLLPQEEKDRVAGFVINKFRGDLSLLQPGIRQFEDLVQKPVYGTVPYCRELVVDEEDAIPDGQYPAEDFEERPLDVAVIRFPHIANFTDLAPLAHDPSVSMRYVTHPGQLGTPDLIVIPGTKNTLDDLHFIQSRGMVQSILHRHSTGSLILGICGGFQMLGNCVRDPHHVESRLEKIDGLGLFNHDTTMMKEKITRQIRRTTLASAIFRPGLTVEGYEIHSGITRFPSSPRDLFSGQNGEEPHGFGIVDGDGTVVGTYLHGFLDNDDLRNEFLGYVREKRGLRPAAQRFHYRMFREKQLDRLGDLVETSLDVKRIFELAEIAS